MNNKSVTFGLTRRYYVFPETEALEKHFAEKELARELGREIYIRLSTFPNGCVVYKKEASESIRNLNSGEIMYVDMDVRIMMCSLNQKEEE